jgi:regulator of sigma E protease
MQTFISIVIALIIFSILVVFHEFGHFIVARKCGVTVNEFSVGMGPRLFSRVAKSGTRYSIKALPFGGSCAMLGEDEDNDEEGAFNSKSLGARMAIVFAGPLFNFILAFLMALIFVGFKGTDPSYVVQVTEGSAAEKAGVQVGDRIIKYNGESVSIGREIYLEEYINPLTEKEDEVKLTVKRNGKTKEISYTADSETKPLLGITYGNSDSVMEILEVTKGGAMEAAGAMMGDQIVEINGETISSTDDFQKVLNQYKGKDFKNTEFDIKLKRKEKIIEVKVRPKTQTIYDLGFYYNLHAEKQSPLGVVKYSYVETKYVIKMVIKGLGKLITGQVSANDISGPVGIVDTIGDTYSQTKDMGTSVTFFSLLSLAIMLSANLGIMNLLPIPALDGGRLLLYIVELIFRKPIPRDKEGMIHFVGFVLLMGLMVFLIFNDIRKIFFW